jgi:hypothetical protein
VTTNHPGGNWFFDETVVWWASSPDAAPLNDYATLVIPPVAAATGPVCIGTNEGISSRMAYSRVTSAHYHANGTTRRSPMFWSAGTTKQVPERAIAFHLFQSVEQAE